MEKLSKQIWLGIALIFLSALTYYIHYLIFHDAHHIFIYMVGDIAFVFIEVLMVSLIIHKMLEEREKKNRLEKLNMIIGVFFSEIGTNLLAYFSELDPNLDAVRKDLIVTSNWTDTEFLKVSRQLKTYSYRVDPAKLNPEELRCLIGEKRDFLLSMMENPNLMEHETFTELLRSVFHIAEELKFRTMFNDLPEEDLGHIAGDIDRAYELLVREWVAYMKHLKANFPYFFSLAMRTNPFDQNASVVIGNICAI
ncbi:MAG TPA: hypothetical protein ENN05_03850 [Deltaproteobacteria bacterium]|nr:hypothetical protein [Deltaproteobacteria bacterium]